MSFAALMAAARRALEGEFRADVQAQFRLVVNAYEPHLASLNNGKPAGRCYSQRPAVVPPGCAGTRERQRRRSQSYYYGLAPEIRAIAEHTLNNCIRVPTRWLLSPAPTV